MIFYDQGCFWCICVENVFLEPVLVFLCFLMNLMVLYMFIQNLVQKIV